MAMGRVSSAALGPDDIRWADENAREFERVERA